MWGKSGQIKVGIMRNRADRSREPVRQSNNIASHNVYLSDRLMDLVRRSKIITSHNVCLKVME